MDIDNIKQINAVLKKIEINDSFISDPSFIKTLVIGPTGSGKTSVINALVGNDLFIRQMRGRRVSLEGPGVKNECFSNNLEPQIINNSISRIAYYELMEIENDDNLMIDFINSAVLNNIFNQKAPYKANILLVISAQDIEAQRGRCLLEILRILESQIQNFDELRQGIGLIITKGDSDCVAADYLELLSEEPMHFQHLINFFLQNLDHVFFFPKPSRCEIDGIYTFHDRDRLNNFLHSNFTTNINYHIYLKDKSKLELINMEKINTQTIIGMMRGIGDESSRKIPKSLQTHSNSRFSWGQTW